VWRVEQRAALDVQHWDQITVALEVVRVVFDVAFDNSKPIVA
jgi:hypothetical protein